MNDEIKTNPVDRAHHPYSPSTLQAIETCPCYEGRQTSHVRAIEGTKMHAITETGVDDNSVDDDDAILVAECLDFFGQRKQLMISERQKAVQKYVQERLNNSTFQLEEAFRKAPIPEIFELKELYLPVDDLEFDDGTKHTTAGYFDRSIIDHTGTYCEAFDWKFGKWAVENTENNLQAIAYVLGLFKKFPRLESIRFFFKQPAINKVSEHLFRRDEIPALYLRVQVVVARAREARKLGDFSSANPTIPNCLFCRHIGICPAVTKFACRIGSKFAPLKIPDSVTPSMIQDPQQTALGMQLAQVMKVWAEAFRKVTSDRVMRGAPLPDGYELKTRAGSRQVINPVVFKQLAKHYLTDEEYESALDIGLGAIEKAIGDKQPRGSKKEAIQNFKAALEEKEVVERGNDVIFLQAKSE